MRTRSGVLAVALPLAAALLASACSSSSSSGSSGAAGGSTAAAASVTKITAIGAENEYANVIGQIGGKYVHVSSIMSNPNTDPHTFEASPAVAREVSAAQLIVQNGVGYDDWMTKIESAVAERQPQGHQRPAAPRPARQHPEPAPVVQPDDDAGGGQARSRPTSRRWSPRTRPTSRPTPPRSPPA